MARPGRPRKHDPVADEIGWLLRSGNDDDAARSLIARHSVDVLDGEASTPLIWASAHNRRSLLEWLLSKGANVNHQDRDGYCALHFAGQNRHVEIADILLKAGAATELRDVYGNTPLWTAGFSARGDYRVFSALLRHGASLDNENNAGRTVRELALTLFPDDLRVLTPNAT